MSPDRIVGYSNSLFGNYKNASSFLTNATVSFAQNTFPTIELTFAPESEVVKDITPYTTFLMLTEPETHFFVISKDIEMDSTGMVTIVVTGYGIMGFLRNTIQPFAEFHNTTPADFFRAIIANHNAMCEPTQRFIAGNCDVTNSTDNVYRFLDDSANTLDSLNDKLVSRLGGTLNVRANKNTQQIVIDYLNDNPRTASVTISLSVNLIASGQLIDATDAYNAIKPLGATIDNNTDTTNQKQDVSSPRLTVSSVNNGSAIVIDPNRDPQMPLIVHSQTWDDVTDANILLSKAKDAISQAKPVTETITVSALDMKLIQGQETDMIVGNYVRIVNQILGLDVTVELTAVTMDLIQPSNNQYTLGTLPTTLMSMNKELQKFSTAQDQIMRIQQLTIARQEKANAAAEADRKSLSDQLAQAKSDLQATTRRLNDYINSQNNGVGGNGSGGDINGSIIDVSEFQGDINWPLVKYAGLALAIIRIQDGSDYIDKKYVQNLQGVLTNHINYGVYAFYRASSNSDAATEATNFYNRVQSVVKGKQQPRFYMLDIETIEMGGNASAMRGGVEAYMNQLNALGVPDSKIVLYIANQLYTQLNLNVSRAGSIVIPAYGSIPAHPYDLHQYTSAGHIAGISTNVDMSNGASARFIKQYITA